MESRHQRCLCAYAYIGDSTGFPNFEALNYFPPELHSYSHQILYNIHFMQLIPFQLGERSNVPLIRTSEVEHGINEHSCDCLMRKDLDPVLTSFQPVIQSEDVK